jgi:hypothetical protein
MRNHQLTYARSTATVIMDNARIPGQRAFLAAGLYVVIGQDFSC